MALALTATLVLLAGITAFSSRLPQRAAFAATLAIGACALGVSVAAHGTNLVAVGFAVGAALASRTTQSRALAGVAALVAAWFSVSAPSPHDVTLVTLLVAGTVWTASGAALGLLVDATGSSAQAGRAGVFFGLGTALLVASWTRGGPFIPLTGVLEVVVAATPDGPSAFAEPLHGRAPWLFWWCLAVSLASIVGAYASARVAGVAGAALAALGIVAMMSSDPAATLTSWVSAPGSRVGSAMVGTAPEVPMSFWGVFLLCAGLPLVPRKPVVSAPLKVAFAGGLWIAAAMLVHAWCWWVGEEATGHVWAALPLAAGMAALGALLLGAGRGSWGDAALSFGSNALFAGSLVLLLVTT